MHKTYLLSIGFLLMVLFCTSCKKEGAVTSTVTFTGTIYRNADSTPMTNTSFVVYSEIGTSLVSGRQSDQRTTPFTTDENGNFSVLAEIFKSGQHFVSWPEDPLHGGHILEIELAPQGGVQNLGFIYAK